MSGLGVTGFLSTGISPTDPSNQVIRDIGTLLFAVLILIATFVKTISELLVHFLLFYHLLEFSR